MSVGTYDFFDAFKKRHGQAPESAVVAPAARADGAGSAYALRALEAEAEKVATQAKGGRNEQLNTSAFNIGTLIAGGELDENHARAVLTGAGMACGLSSGEVHQTINSGIKGGLQHPRVAPPLAETPVEVTEVALATLLPEADQPLAATFWTERPILAHIRQFALARMASPWGVLGVCLARALCTIDPHVTLPPLIGGRGSLNLFVALVAISGGGKGTSESAARDALDFGCDIHTATVGSGEGIAHQYAHTDRDGQVEDRRAVLFSVPEVDAMVAIGSRQGSTLMSQLRSAFSGEQLGFSYADRAKRIELLAHEYRMGIVLGVQPARARPLLDDADGGTPQRFIWLPATDKDISADVPPEPRPWRVTHPWPRPVGGVSPAAMTVEIPEAVAWHIRDQHARRARGEGDALDGHSMFAREKVAVALSILDGRYKVTEDDWRLSGVVAAMSQATRAGVEARLSVEVERANEARAKSEGKRQVIVSETVAEAATKRVCRAIQRALRRSGEGLKMAELRRRVTSSDRGYFEDAIEVLVAAGDVLVGDSERGQIVRLPDDDR